MPLSDFQAEDAPVLINNMTAGGNSDDVFFIMQNVYNDLLTALLESHSYYLNELQDRTS
jgi:hypothetical protein